MPNFGYTQSLKSLTIFAQNQKFVQQSILLIRRNGAVVVQDSLILLHGEPTGGFHGLAAFLALALQGDPGWICVVDTDAELFGYEEWQINAIRNAFLLAKNKDMVKANEEKYNHIKKVVECAKVSLEKLENVKVEG